MDALTLSERQSPIWEKIEEYLKARRSKAINQLIAKEDPEARGKIKELDHLLTPPDDRHTAQ